MFQTHDNLEHLAMMERILGPLPSHMIKVVTWPDHMIELFFNFSQLFSKKKFQKTKKSKYFRKGRLDWDSQSTDGKYVRENCKPLMRYCRRRDDPEHMKLFDLIAQVPKIRSRL